MIDIDWDGLYGETTSTYGTEMKISSDSIRKYIEMLEENVRQVHNYTRIFRLRVNKIYGLGNYADPEEFRILEYGTYKR